MFYTTANKHEGMDLNIGIACMKRHYSNNTRPTLLQIYGWVCLIGHKRMEFRDLTIYFIIRGGGGGVEWGAVRGNNRCADCS